MRTFLIIFCVLLAIVFLFLSAFAERVAVAFVYVLLAMLSMMSFFHVYFNNQHDEGTL